MVAQNLGWTTPRLCTTLAIPLAPQVVHFRRGNSAVTSSIFIGCPGLILLILFSILKPEIWCPQMHSMYMASFGIYKILIVPFNSYF
jgi:hypothetical protein